MCKRYVYNHSHSKEFHTGAKHLPKPAASKGTDLDGDYELIVFSNYFPGSADKVSNEDTGDFYKHKEFESTWGPFFRW